MLTDAQQHEHFYRERIRDRKKMGRMPNDDEVIKVLEIIGRSAREPFENRLLERLLKEQRKRKRNNK